MTGNEASLTPFENLGAVRSMLPELFAESCKPILVYFVFSRRHAWQNTSCERYRDSSFHLHFYNAQEAAEPIRVQGTQWEIQELPACAFISRGGILVVSQINTRPPLDKWVDSVVWGPNTSLYKLATLFSPTRPNSIIRLFSPVTELTEFRDPRWLFCSRSRGGKSRLAWRHLDLGVLHEGSNRSLLARSLKPTTTRFPSLSKVSRLRWVKSERTRIMPV
jgi:hypothetical protein